MLDKTMRATDNTDREIFAFAHVPKTAGQLVRLLLRQRFGLRHMDVEHRKTFVYRLRDFRADLRVCLSPRSIAGQALKPYTDFGEFTDRMVWYTVLRDPVRRYVSQYMYDTEVMGWDYDIPGWIANADRGNMQLWTLAGCLDVDRGKEILEKMRCVGLTEHLNESLLMIRERLGLRGFELTYSRPKNTAADRRGADRQRIREEFERRHDEVLDRNKLDIELYDYAVNEIWPRQVADYGRERLDRHVESEFATAKVSLSRRCRWWTGFFHRNLIYKPCVKLDRRLRKHPGPPLGPRD